MRATQLYSVIEQDQIVSRVDGSSGAAPAATTTTSLQSSSTDSTSSLPANPFEMSQERIAEIPEEEDAAAAVQQPVEDLPLINVYITETVHVLSKAGEAEKSVVWGEIGIDYKGPAVSATPICFRIDHQQSLDSIETTDYASVLDGYSLQDNIFKINTERYHQQHVGTLDNTATAVCCIKYQTKLSHLPITVKPIWKCEAEKSRLLVKYHVNAPATATLDKVMFVTSVTGKVQHALSIPAGELVLSQNRIKWHLGHIAANDGEQVIKAQFTTLEQASPQPIAVRFEIRDYLLSDVSVQQGADAAVVLWAKICNITKIVKAGKYIADA